ncbi:unnamed protein product [Ilex paraguariensis]|uniref:Uncharacterized protein n=1 Tax=Ilex paraguariensis TaxID=185542 RepID=A0ABC8QZA9_9AQUA
MHNKLKRSLRRIMANVRGSCVEAKDSGGDGKLMMNVCFDAMYEVFPMEVSVLSLGNRRDYSSLALIDELSECMEKGALSKPL